MPFMKWILLLMFSTGLYPAPALFGQGPEVYKWWDPAANAFPVIGGRLEAGERAAAFDRLPVRAERSVSPKVWELSHNSAGLYIGFRTNAANIAVRYAVKGNLSMYHMPSTGVSGIDLYCIDKNGKWLWAPGSRKNGDTIEYIFPHLRKTRESGPVEHRLYLPLYTSVIWMQVGVPGEATFDPLPLSTTEKPVVVYGTSITQGACASRPGMCWANLLQQRLDRPLINLGFSGNGHLEPAVIDLMSETDACLYILDCLPNMTPAVGYSATELGSRVTAAVGLLKAKRPGTPIILTEHSGGTDHGILDTAK